MNIEIKKSKSMPAREGLAWCAEIWVDGVKGCFIRDQGQGGPIELEWFNDEAKQKIEKVVNELPPDMSEPELFPEGHKISVDTYLAGLVDEHEDEKRWKAKVRRDCKTKLCFRLKGQPKKDYRFLQGKNVLGPAGRKYLRDRYGDQLEEILNDTLDKS